MLVMPNSKKGESDNDPNIQATSALESLMPEINTLSAVPDHVNVVKFFGVALRGTTLFGLSELVPPLSLPPEFLAVIPPPLTNNGVTLDELLKICLESQQRQGTSLLEQVLPMDVREKILRNVALGLEHLHCLVPPIVHGHLHPGNIFITSLESAGTGPVAKVACGVGTVHQGCNDAIDPSSDVIGSNSANPPELFQGNSFPTTKSDVWSFGILVHNTVDPPSLSTASPQPPGSTKNSLLPPCTTTQHLPNTMPPWAHQVTSCCLVSDPSLRPSMTALLKIWDYV